MAKRRKRTVFATPADGKTLYVELRAVMSFLVALVALVALVDGIPMTFFGKEQTPYLPIDKAIEWLSDESSRYPNDKSLADRLAAVIEAKRKFDTGKTQPVA